MEMKEWPYNEVPDKDPLPPNLQILADSIGRALEEKWRDLTDTTGPEPRTFAGFGWPDAVIEYLSSRGIDTSGLRIETGPRNRVVSVYAPDRVEPIFYRYFGDQSEEE